MNTTVTRTPLNEHPECAPPCADPVANAAIAMLTQCEAFIHTVSLKAYAAESSAIRGGSIGKHIRHILDHFRACLDADRPGHVVDYDHRQRNVAMETDPAAALLAIARIQERLECIDAAGLCAPVRVRVMLTADGFHAELGSTFGRELAFATHHAVHHHAMLAVIAAEMGVATDPQLGKAPATIRHDRVRC